MSAEAVQMLRNHQIWWDPKIEKGKRHESLFPYVRALLADQAEERELRRKKAHLYDVRARLLGDDCELVENENRGNSGSTNDIISPAVDTATSKIAKNRPRPSIQTDGADWSVQRRARQMGRFLESEFRRTGIHNEGVRVFRDALVIDLGALKIYDDDGQIVVERTISDEIVVDEEECRSAKPRQMFQRRPVSIDILIADYEKFEEEILEAWKRAGSPASRQILVVEGWHLRSSKKAKDGRHIIAIDGADLLDEEYTRDWFPFVFYRWGERMTGFRGKGMVEHLAPKQFRLNKLNKFIEECQDRVAIPRYFVGPGDAKLKSSLTTRVGEVVVVPSGKKPEMDQRQAVSGDMYQQRRELRAEAFEETGISQAAAQGEKPAGVDSAAAVREVSHRETERFAIQEQAYEEMFLDAAWMFIAIAKEIYGRASKKQGALKTKWRSRNLIKVIDWHDVDLEIDGFDMSIEASSLLTRTPAGRTQTVIEWAQAGIISQDEARRLLAHPDLERQVSLMTAAIEDAEALIEELCDGNYQPPEALQNLPLCMRRVQQAYLKAKRDGAPPEILDDFQTWLLQAHYVYEELGRPSPIPGEMPPDAGVPPQAALAPQAMQVAPQ